MACGLSGFLRLAAPFGAALRAALVASGGSVRTRAVVSAAVAVLTRTVALSLSLRTLFGRGGGALLAVLLTAVGSVAIVSIASVVAAARTVVAAVSLLDTAALRRCAVLSRRTGLLGRAFGLLRGGSVAVLAAAAVLTVAAVFTAVFAAVAVAAAAAFGVVEARDAVLLRTERRFVGFGFEVAVVLQLLGALAGTVERQNCLLYTSDAADE